MRRHARNRELVTRSERMKSIIDLAMQVAPSNISVLIEGESGTGKELLAHLIHDNSPRQDKPFVTVNCTALAETLLESELFGHVKGAFTGAVKDRQGRFEAADGGTIFLDEIGEIPPPTQVKLLRFLQNKEFERVGETTTSKVDVRVIAATNRDLEEAVSAGGVPGGSVLPAECREAETAPAARAAEDIPLLAQHFLKKFGSAAEISRRSADAALQAYPWKGNVRELENVIERAVILCAWRIDSAVSSSGGVPDRSLNRPSGTAVAGGDGAAAHHQGAADCEGSGRGGGDSGDRPGHALAEAEEIQPVDDGRTLHRCTDAVISCRAMPLSAFARCGVIDGRSRAFCTISVSTPISWSTVESVAVNPVFIKRLVDAGSVCMPAQWHPRLPQHIDRTIPSSYFSSHSGGTMAVKTTTLQSGKIGVIEVKGSLVGGEETDELRSAVADFVEQGTKKLIIDLGKVTYLNSTAIGVLVSAHTTFSKNKGHVKLCEINKNINNIFVITKLTLVFDVAETREEAVKAFGAE